MERRTVTALLVISVAFTFLAIPAVASAHPEQPSATRQVQDPLPALMPGVGMEFARLPYADIMENTGQISADVRFYAVSRQLTVGFAESAVYYVYKGPRFDNYGPAPRELLLSQPQSQGHGVVVRVTFDASNRVLPEGRGESSYRSHFFIGQDPQRWHKNVRSYSEILYRDLYDGVDLLYRVGENGIKYEFLVAPGVDERSIALRYEGVDRLAIEGREIVATTSLTTFRDASLIGYQNEKEVPCTYVLRSRLSFGFHCHPRLTFATLVIDPIVYSTYLGGFAGEEAWSVVADSSGDAYVTGYAGSSDFPTTPGAFDTTVNVTDVIVTKVNASGTGLVFSTFLGGSGQDFGTALALGSDGSVFVVGYGDSADFPTTAGAFQRTKKGGWGDAFITRLTAAGDGILYSTYLGGNDNDRIWGIAVDDAGIATVAGDSSSSDFPTTPGAYSNASKGGLEIVVARVNATGGSLLFSTYIGSVGWDWIDWTHSVAVDGSGRVFVAGVAGSNDFPTTPGAFDTTYNGGPDGVWFELDDTGSSLLYSTFLGGSQEDRIRSLALAANNDVFVAGLTLSPDFPITSGAFDVSFGGAVDAFVARFNASGYGLSYSTFVGGSGDDYGNSVAVDSMGNAFVSGYTKSSNFPVTPNAFDRTFNGLDDVFVTKLNASGTGLLYSTYLGANNEDYGWAMAVDSFADMYLAGITLAAGFPTVLGSFDTTYNGGADIFLTKISTSVPVTLSTNPAGLSVDLDGVPHVSPYSFRCDEATIHVIGVQSPQTGGSTRNTFVSWSDRGAQSHAVTCGTTSTYVATFLTEDNVTFATEPLGLQLELNGSAVTTPYSLWCIGGSSIPLNAPSPQFNGSTRYAFVNWSDGMPQAHTIVCDRPATFVAGFVPQFQVDVLTSPVALNVSIDGFLYPSGTTFWFDENSSHTLFAPSPQLTAPGIQYSFVNWSDGPSTRTWTVVVSGPGEYVANYQLQYRVVVDTSPTGLALVVDGTPAIAPASFFWDAGSLHTVVANSTQYAGTDTRFRFFGWSDGNPSPTEAIIADGVKSVTASYFTQYLLAMSTNFGTVSPGSGWYNSGDIVSISSTAPPGSATDRYRFDRWSGDYTGTTPTGTITMDGPKTTVANWVHEYRIDILSNVPSLAIEVDGSPVTTPAVLWWAEGSSHALTAPDQIPIGADARWRFQSWSDGSTSLQLAISSVAGPSGISAAYVRQFLLTIVTSPAGRTVTVDGTPYTSPAWVDENGQVVLDAGSLPQSGGAGTRYVFRSWETGSTTATRSITIIGPVTTTATYDTQFELTINSSYGNPVCQGAEDADGCWYLKSAQATVSATSPFDALNGNTYVLTGWSGDASSTGTTVAVLMDAPKSVTAAWQQVFRVTVDSVPAGLEYVVDGTTLTGRDEFLWIPGSFHSVDVPSPQGVSEGARYRWSSWSDYGARAHSVTARGPAALVAVFHRQFLLTVNSPYSSTSCDVPDCWYDEGQSAQFSVLQTDVQADGRHHRLTGWTGDANLTTATGRLTMDRPLTVTATWTEVSFLEDYWWVLLIPVAVAFGVLLFLWSRKRRKGKSQETEQRAPR